MRHAVLPRILVVEDQLPARDALAEMLSADGFDVAVAGDGEEALGKAASFSPDVVVMDFGLPGLNGWETTLRLKRDPQTAQVPVIAVTGHGKEEARVLGREVGCLEVFTKPVDIDRLTTCLRALTEGTPADSPTPIELPGDGC
jgi:two-component system, cell cycle response regulator DivK